MGEELEHLLECRKSSGKVVQTTTRATAANEAQHNSPPTSISGFEQHIYYRAAPPEAHQRRGDLVRHVGDAQVEVRQVNLEEVSLDNLRKAACG